MKVFENEARVEEYIRAKENWYATEMENRKKLLFFYGIEWGKIEELVKQCEVKAKSIAEDIYNDLSILPEELPDNCLDELQKHFEWTTEDRKNRKKINRLKKIFSDAKKLHIAMDFLRTLDATGKPMPSFGKMPFNKEVDMGKRWWSWMIEHKTATINTLKRSADGDVLKRMLDFEVTEKIPPWVKQIFRETVCAIHLIETAENVRGILFLENARECPTPFDILTLEEKKLDKMKWDGKTFHKPVGRKKLGDGEKSIQMIQWIVGDYERLQKLKTRDRNTEIIEIFASNGVTRGSDKTCDTYWKLATAYVKEGRK